MHKKELYKHKKPQQTLRLLPSSDQNDKVIVWFNPLGVIIKNVNSSVFCGVKRNKKCIENRF